MKSRPFCFVPSLLLLAIAAGTTQAAVINATADVAGGWFDLAGTVAPADARIMAGSLSAAAPLESRNGMAVFALPNIPAGDTVTSAKLSLNLFQVNLFHSMGVGMGIDVYAMRVSNSTAYSVADHYIGAFPGIGNAAGNGAIGIQDDLIEFNNNVPPFQPPVNTVYSTDAAASAALGAYLQSNAYSSLSGTPSSTYILLRVNHDFEVIPQNFHLARFTDAEGTAGGPIRPIPVLEMTTAPAVPEPASLVLCVLAVGLVALHRNCASGRSA